MSSRVLDWLPDSALTGALFAARAAQLAADWSERWFAAAVRTAGLEVVRPGAQRIDETWRRYLGGVALRFGRAQAMRLAERALGVQFDALAPTGSDTRVALALAQRMVDDFGRSFGDALEGAGPAADDFSDGFVRLHLEHGGERLLDVAAATQGVIRLAKSRLPPIRPLSLRGATLAKSLAGVEARADVMLGTAEMSLAELRSLSPGDVVVLDRAVRAGASIAARASGAEVARGALTKSDGRIAITLQS